MINALRNAYMNEKEAFRVPRSVQKSIPIKRIYQDGIFQVGPKFSKSWRFTDINYMVASPEQQLSMFLDYCGVLNALPTDATSKITVTNRRLNDREFAENILMQHKGDGFNLYRDENNRMIESKARATNKLVQDKCITVSVRKKNIEEARTFFARVHTDLKAHFGHLSSQLNEISTHDRLRALHDFYRPGKEQYFDFDLKRTMQRGHDFRDFICPDSLEFKDKHAIIGDKFARVLFLKDYASYIKDSMINDLTGFSRNLMLSIDIVPVPKDEAEREINNRMMSVEGDISRWQRKANMNGDFNALLPYDLEEMRKETKEYLDDIRERDQRMMFVVVTLMHTADTLEALDQDTETLCSIGRKNLCTFAPLTLQQEDGLNTVLPYGLRRIDALRTLTTESTAVLLPFNVQEIMHEHGEYIGVNPISKNLIICNRKALLNGGGFIAGVSGSGKSLAAKYSAWDKIVNTEDDVILIDPEREYGPLVRAMGAEVIPVSAQSATHINALSMPKDYGMGDNPIITKSEFLLSLCEQVMGGGFMGPKEKSLIDRCTSLVFRGYIKDYKGEPPTLQDFHAELLRQPEPEAQDIALCMELFTQGSLSTFAHQTNCDTESRILCYDLFDLSKQLKTVGMLVVLDQIAARVARNRRLNIRTHIFIDEVYLFFAHEYSANFLSEAWKRYRKAGGLMTGITQNVTDCLQSHVARVMLANSEFLLLLSQAPVDRVELQSMFGLSDIQTGYLASAEPGRGLVRIGNAIVPFENDFDTSTELYKLISTKPGENL